MFNYPTLRRQTSWSPLNQFFDLEGTDTVWNPACDVSENEGHYVLSLEMPGVSKDQITLEAVENRLTVSGERRHEDKKEGEAWYSERRYGKFERAFTLPPGIDTSKIEANYQDGILKVVVPKTETLKPRQIKINTAA